MATMQAAQSMALSSEDLAALEADLGRLNDVATGLGDRCVRYVAAGTDTSVLMEIKGLGPAPMQTFMGYYGPAYERHLALRRRALVDTQAWRPAVLHRFAVLLVAIADTVG